MTIEIAHVLCKICTPCMACNTLPAATYLAGVRLLLSRLICMYYAEHRLQRFLKAPAYRREANSCRQVFGFSRKESEVRALLATIQLLKDCCSKVCAAASVQQFTWDVCC